jgi:8-oxo-dGTP pyrophosphatase MutT (NUDIX family)/phosphohistidine phosphatase SixA
MSAMAAPTTASGPDVVAAGAVVARNGPRGREVLLVHRPKYDDWSFPKGKQDPGEHVTATAIREVLEETGVEIRLGRPLLPQLYAVSGGRAKKVHYWVGHVVGDDDVSTYQINDEVDELAWFDLDKAKERLTYLDDIDLLEQFRSARKKTDALAVVRHAKAVKRGTWDGPDPERPLTPEGEAQAEALSPILHAFGMSRVLSSSSARCVQTVVPFTTEHVVPLEQVDELSEESYDEASARTLLDALMAAPGSSVLCSHRPVLPDLFDLLGADEEPLSPAELVVVHHRNGKLVATERHRPL